MSAVARVALRFRIDGGTIDIPDVVTTFHAKYTAAGEPDATEINDLLTAVSGDWWGTAQGEWPNTIILEDITYAQIDPLPAPVPTVLSVGVAGDLTGAPMTPQDSVVFSWRTALAGRSYRGRSFMPPPDRASVGIDGLIDAGSLDGFADAAVLLVDSVNGAGLANVWTFGVWSRKNAADPLFVGDPFTEVTLVKVGNRVDTMRSRAVATETYEQRTPA